MHVKIYLDEAVCLLGLRMAFYIIFSYKMFMFIKAQKRYQRCNIHCMCYVVNKFIVILSLMLLFLITSFYSLNLINILKCSIDFLTNFDTFFINIKCIYPFTLSVLSYIIYMRINPLYQQKKIFIFMFIVSFLVFILIISLFLINVNDFLLSSCIVFTKKSLPKTILNKLQVYSISKRFYPGSNKPMGHAKKVLDAKNKTPLPPTAIKPYVSNVKNMSNSNTSPVVSNNTSSFSMSNSMPRAPQTVYEKYPHLQPKSAPSKEVVPTFYKAVNDANKWGQSSFNGQDYKPLPNFSNYNYESVGNGQPIARQIASIEKAKDHVKMIRKGQVIEMNQDGVGHIKSPRFTPIDDVELVEVMGRFTICYTDSHGTTIKKDTMYGFDKNGNKTVLNTFTYDPNIDPSKSPARELFKNKDQNELKPLTNHSGKPIKLFSYNTNGFDLNRLLEAAKERQLITDDSKESTKSNMITEEGHIVPVGAPINNHKLTTLGQAYNKTVASIENKHNNNNDTHILKSLPDHVKDMRVLLGGVNYPQVVIKTGEHNHAYVAIKIGDYYYSPGYFTGMISDKKLSDKLFSTFQKELDSGQQINTAMNTKMQYITQPKALVRIPTQNAITLKYGSNYLKYISQEKYFEKRFEALSTKSSVDYDPNNLTHQRVFHMIHEHDARVQCGIPHPQTDHQIQQQVLAQEQQKKLQEDKKKNKEYNNKNYKDFKKPSHEPFS